MVLHKGYNRKSSVEKNYWSWVSRVLLLRQTDWWKTDSDGKDTGKGVPRVIRKRKKKKKKNVSRREICI
jgi:hypothetical protein